MTEASKIVDAKGQSCPMPVLLTAKGIKDLESGQVMLVEVTDSGARSDIPAWASQTGNELVESSEADGVMKFYIRKK
ncbi:MAG: sulfurtransferase TusA family protein [Candidatus Nanopelagicales bacterium]|jgi:tRNA 2-thiouridine synthesizing protein A|nr:sulfurtransferase TusA family protein [Candidatus Nanopelagicales bacterium]MDP4715680.1 sulfurtransferase TusA family protein [Candidatus Nanopelagicales bacterium]MDP4907814.1 sulfurtransferase TusA family protein [Candidatus Nanopelagicales bacterium]MDP4976105.1 sulfurtransferase TusA family protein [Candidatus Nanopelagicales bacterium]MDP5094466.1 sulfurtransferase TusA family protein [Candidatus Nanopelagicales bacterium]